MKTWCTEDVAILKKLYENNTNAFIAKKLNKSELAVYKKAYNLKLKKNKEFTFKQKSAAHSGEKNNFWKGGRKTNAKGYVLILKKEHPFAGAGGYIFEHRLVMENHIGRYLNKDEIVHHKNGIKNDNRIENLELTTFSEHVKTHHVGSFRSSSTREKISKKAKERLSDKKNHPLFKNIEKETLIKMRKSGMKIKEICKILKICNRTYYNKMEE